MKSKRIILILNIAYLLGALYWAITEKSTESFVALIGVIVSWTTFLVASNNWSFSVTNKENRKQNVDNKGANIGEQKYIQGNNYEYNQ